MRVKAASSDAALCCAVLCCAGESGEDGRGKDQNRQGSGLTEKSKLRISP